MIRMYFLFSVLFLTGIVFSCKKSTTEKSCRENIHSFKLAKEAIGNKEKELRKLKATDDNIVVLSDSLIEILVNRDTGYVNIMNLWDKYLLAKGKSIYLNDNGSMLFVLPQQNTFVVYDSIGYYGNTCGVTEKVKHFLEKDWYYLVACSE